MSGDSRFTYGLIIDVFDVLEKHGYHRADDQHTGRSMALLLDLVQIYEGTEEEPSGASPPPRLSAERDTSQDPESGEMEPGQ